ncbi:glucosyltransferase [Fistulina hepatica ATCC 64428]|uniref:Dol-P-Glc:Glc(2)Man(9)GlcNAc(2)-PP-Dol alpha-1,2-glucosyltransferase n=1 Tax=Fistulina hepatica ATCC 64428 TaxID=1128425 RepID=A0A0D7A3A3_9AGAR|nr:glucosyltransferase [Fistulina hepatica ATCC 64428]
MTFPYQFLAFCVISLAVLMQFNHVLNEPYMDEPFHIPQAQAYCKGNFYTWDPKLTTPPGLYIWSLFLHYASSLDCSDSFLRLTVTIFLLCLPNAIDRLINVHRHAEPSLWWSPSSESIVISTFPIAWFFGFLYYTEIPSLLFVSYTVVAAMSGRNWLAALIGLLSCTFRQTNIVWTLYAYAAGQLLRLKARQRRNSKESKLRKFYDPPALSASFGDLPKVIASAFRILPDVIVPFIPYAGTLAVFAAFVIWNGGIVLGDKSNHIPVLHIPQMYYFISFCTALGWPVLISARGGVLRLAKSNGKCRRILITLLLCGLMSLSVRFNTIHHPFLLSDNRHYTFYVWRRIYMYRPIVPYAFVPVYLACFWAWFSRAGRDQTLLQTLILPIFCLPVLLPTPLLEPRYFLIPYILLRVQVRVPKWALTAEALWYAFVNVVTVGVFLYKPREGVGRFMW